MPHKQMISATADEAWGAAIAAQRINQGYIKSPVHDQSGDIVKQTNRAIAYSILNDKQDRVTDEDKEKIEIIKNHFRQLSFKILTGKALNDYEATVSRIIENDMFTSPYDFAVLVSLPQSYERDIDNQAREQDLKENSVDEFLAPVKTRVDAKIRIVKSVYSRKYDTYFMNGLTESNHRVFFAYRSDLEVDSTVSVRGTVKGHRDPFTTQLNRVKVM